MEDHPDQVVYARGGLRREGVGGRHDRDRCCGIAGCGKPARGHRAGWRSFDGQPERRADLAGPTACPHAGECWLYCVLPLLAYTSLAILFSVATRNGILGVLGPLIVALATQLLDLIGKGVIVHLGLIGSAFDGWHGLFQTHPFLGPLAVSSLVCLVWIAACLGTSWRIVRSPQLRLENEHPAPELGRSGPGCRGCHRRHRSARPWLQHRPRRRDPAPAECRDRAGVQQRDPGAAGRDRASRSSRSQAGRASKLQSARRRQHRSGRLDLHLYVYLPQPNSVPFQQTSVEYDVSVQSNGCYKAQSPPAFFGGRRVTFGAGPSPIRCSSSTAASTSSSG